jgi:hypothetical protein
LLRRGAEESEAELRSDWQAEACPTWLRMGSSEVLVEGSGILAHDGDSGGVGGIDHFLLVEH